MLKYNEPNVLSVFGMRRMDHCPPHFAPVLFPQIAQEKELTDWIWENLTGRFYYGDFYTELSNGGTDVQKCAAFEIHGEASYFALLLPTINAVNSSITIS